MRQWKSLILGAIVAICSSAVFADGVSGNWKTIDDKTGQQKGLVNISDNGGTLSGTIIQTYNTTLTTCTACTGSKKDKPIKGMTILWGLKKTGDNEWSGGSILDPKTGKVYRAKMTLKGNQLLVRGYIGISALGRTQTWHR